MPNEADTESPPPLEGLNVAQHVVAEDLAQIVPAKFQDKVIEVYYSTQLL